MEDYDDVDTAGGLLVSRWFWGCGLVCLACWVGLGWIVWGAR